MEESTVNEIIKYINQLKQKGYPAKIIIKTFEDRIIQLKDDYLSCEFVCLFQENKELLKFEEHEQIVLKGKDLYCNLAFAKIPRANVRAHGQIILESKDLDYNLEFAYIPGANVRAHGQIIIDSKDIMMNYYFAKIPGADVRAHGQIILESQEIFWNSAFAEIPGADLRAHNEVIAAQKIIKDSDYQKLESLINNNQLKKINCKN